MALQHRSSPTNGWYSDAMADTEQPGWLADTSDETFANDVLEASQSAIVVLDFWATWCLPCIDQVPALNAFHEAHAQDSDVAVFGVNTDLDAVESVREWVKQQGVRYPILIGGDKLALDMGAPGFPVTYVLDGQGRIQRRHVGVIKADELERDLAALRGDAS